MLRSLKIKAGYWLEHRIKHLGTLLSSTFAIPVGFMLLTADHFVGLTHYVANEKLIYERLTGVGNILISIVLGISLTTFSVVFVVMQLASSQFSPRILRHFLANDVRIQQYIGLFIGTVALCILPQAASALFYGEPYTITLLTGIFMGIYCLVWSYPRLITYLSINMNVAAIIDRIKQEVVKEIDIIYPEKWQPGQSMLYAVSRPDEHTYTVSITSRFRTGYLESIDYPRFEREVTRFVDARPWTNGLLVYQMPVVGEFIMKDAGLLLAVQTQKEPTPAQEKELAEAFAAIAENVFTVNTFRSYTQDINFGVRKLVDIAIKAISPAVNDPTTCLNCIDHLGDIAHNLQLRRYPGAEACKLKSKNIIAKEFNFDQFIDFCFDQIYQWGKEDPTVVRRLLQTKTLLVQNATNPYNVMVLIRQVRDMEVPLLYNDATIAERHIKINREKLEGVRRELETFEHQAKLKVRKMEQAGLLHYAPAGEAPAIEKKEAKAIGYLVDFISG
ncbi:hypothetical protein AM493_20175 [Flavobacterium akiainvivens]|uniref:DUF2254 domain-containing protein n=1 Tax=Flavobacterium akiainvivens TaxID=1202724 RepID=A0A0M8MDS1_9FLAO|nr:DUF2254 family protein [Flavobacterium akiainvivens]KOS08105.1 hypothetical protein AM493_20175 [Flavobacterium akiainvivens]SFQ71919.1 Uncharacterized membrane protein [Flavobacterium akiainvivens]